MTITASMTVQPNFLYDIQSRPRAGSAGAAPSGTTKVVYEAKLPSSMKAASSSKVMGEVCVQDNCMTVRVRVSQQHALQVQHPVRPHQEGATWSTLRPECMCPS
jgi:hypothetical protein